MIGPCVRRSWPTELDNESLDLVDEAAEDWVSQDLLKTFHPKSVSEDHFCQIAMTAIVLGDPMWCVRSHVLTIVSFPQSALWIYARCSSEGTLFLGPRLLQTTSMTLLISTTCISRTSAWGRHALRLCLRTSRRHRRHPGVLSRSPRVLNVCSCVGCL